MKYKLKPCAQVSTTFNPEIEGGNFTFPLINNSYQLEDVCVYNNQSTGGLKPMGHAEVELIKKETNA